ncbi:hypothetical protein [Nocardia grenadensis]|uniref:hypothetical protein n=1 Tax=Nocardia grenadensis TaxID=931537 RepID=UPI003D738344
MSGVIGRNLKAVEAGVGGLLMLLTMIASINGVFPESWAAGITGAIALLTTVRVWLATNAPLIEDAASAVEDLYAGTVGAFQKRG